MDASLLKNRDVLERVAIVLLVAAVAAVCFAVLRPFLSSMLWAGILVFASWPVYRWVREKVVGNSAVSAAALMTAAATLCLVVPVWLLAASSVNIASWGLEKARELRVEGVPAVVQALKGHPWFSAYAEDAKAALVGLSMNTEQLLQWGAGASKLALHWLVRSGVSAGHALFQIAFSFVFMFAFYLHGESVSEQLGRLAERIGGPVMVRLRGKMARTLRVVVLGAIAAASAQGVAAVLGFWMFGVPNKWLLAAAVFVLGFVPMGPPLVWVPAGLWIVSDGRVGAAIGMLVYGAAVISGVDTFARAAVISGGGGSSGLGGMLRRWPARRRRRAGLGVLVGVLTGTVFALTGIPWWLGGVVAVLMAGTSFPAAGVVGLLGGAIWKFALGQVMNGIWLLLAAGGLSLAMPFLAGVVHRWSDRHGHGPTVPDTGRGDEALPFALTLMGVVGGTLAFGFIGLFLGPVVLSMGRDLLQELTKPRGETEGALPEPAATERTES